MELLDFGGLVRSRREEMGLTQAELAERIGTTAAYVSQIESGRRRWPERYIVAIVGVLDLDEKQVWASKNRNWSGGELVALAPQVRSLLPQLERQLTLRQTRALEILVEALPHADGFDEMPSTEIRSKS